MTDPKKRTPSSYGNVHRELTQKKNARRATVTDVNYGVQHSTTIVDTPNEIPARKKLASSIDNPAERLESIKDQDLGPIDTDEEAARKREQENEDNENTPRPG